MPANTALWLQAKHGPLAVGPAPYTAPRGDEIVVRNRAVAINPIDRLVPSIGDLVLPWLRYPFILGSDVAGEVVEVGSNASRFRVGDRVLGHATGTDKARNNPAEGGFQHHTVLLAHMAAPMPDALRFEEAAVLPLGLSTAACGLFQNDFLALRHPGAHPEPTGETLLVWGGSTSVGSNAIQLAVAAGYDVVATASPHNHDHVLRLGARQAFDYRSGTVVADIVAALRGRTIAGALAIGLGSAAACLDVVHACKGRRFVAMATPGASFDAVPAGRGRMRHLLPTVARLLANNAVMAARTRQRGIGTKFIFGSSLLANEVGPLIYERFLPQALADKRFLAAPQPLDAGHGLDRIPAALALHANGVSAAKLVVSL